MDIQNFTQARQYALDRLERELSPKLIYHGIMHTRDEVVPAVETMAGMEGIAGESFYLLLTAAWFHDLGFIEQSVHHELISARIAVKILPRFGYTDEQVEIVRWAILATALPQSPKSLPEEILTDADLDVLGRDDFIVRNGDLRAELANFGKVYDETEWYLRQLKFLEAHTYFTKSAHARRDAGKLKNIADLEHVLQELGVKK